VDVFLLPLGGHSGKQNQNGSCFRRDDGVGHLQASAIFTPVIPAKAGIHFAVACRVQGRKKQNQNGSLLPQG